MQNDPILKKPITSELGNVTPWVIVPGRYTEAQLRSQAENVIASITNNASFNCIATRMLITCRSWPQRDHFLDLVERILATVPSRYAYYPGAIERYERFSGDTLDLTWERSIAHDGLEYPSGGTVTLLRLLRAS